VAAVRSWITRNGWGAAAVGLVNLGLAFTDLRRMRMQWQVTPDKAVEAMSKFGGTVLKTSLSKEGEKDLQEALHGGSAA
jgi:Protein of unknown function (DUF1269)